jgi:hypothetical protein
VHCIVMPSSATCASCRRCMWQARLAVSRVDFARVAERLCIPAGKQPFHVGQRLSRRHVQAASSARPARATQYSFDGDGLKMPQALARIRAGG